MGRSKIEYEGWVFTGSEIRSGKIYSTISLLQSELEPNSFEAEVECTDSSILSFQRNAPLRYYNDDILTGIFYVQSIKRTSASTYTIEADSAIGILAEGQHYGGIYTGETVEEILPSICGSVPYILHFSFAKIALYGWLPIATPRDNLAQVLFAIGATVKTDRKGILRIESLWDGISGNVGKDKLLLKGSGNTTYALCNNGVIFLRSGEVQPVNFIDRIIEKIVQRFHDVKIMSRFFDPIG